MMAKLDTETLSVRYYPPMTARDAVQPPPLEWAAIKDCDGHKALEIAADKDKRKGSWFARPSSVDRPDGWFRI